MITVRWRMFPLHPETPSEGQSLAEMFRTTPEKVAAMVAGLRFKAAELGLPFGPRSRTFNTRLAQELGIWAEEMGQGEAYHQAAFRAYFADGANLARPEVLLGLVERLGLSVAAADRVLQERLYRDQVDDDWRQAREQGVTAVPTFICGHERLVGAVDFPTLAALLTGQGVVRRT